MIERHRTQPDQPVVSVSDSEPSLVFMLGTATRLATAEGAAQEMADAPTALALVDASDDTAFRAALAKRGRTPRKIDAITGVDYSNGRKMLLTLYAGDPG